MFAFYKLRFLCHFILISVTVSASINTENGFDTDPRIFFYYKDYPEFFTDKITYEKLYSRDITVLMNNQSRIVTLDYYAEEKTLFWATSNGELYSTYWDEDVDKVMTSNQDRDEDPDDEDPDDEDPGDEGIGNSTVIIPKKENIKFLYSQKDWYPRSMALDDVGKKLYIADSYERSIDVFDLNGQNKARIFADDHVIPYEIVIDPSEGLLFLYGINFIKSRTELHRMNMDGSDHRLIVDTIENLSKATLCMKANLVIDKVNKRLFYKASSNNIATVDYNGLSGSLVLKKGNVEYFGIYKNHLFWSKKQKKEKDFLSHVEYLALSLFNTLQNSLKYCELKFKVSNSSAISCGSSVRSKYKDYFHSFKIIDFGIHKKPANPCLETNNECEDHCLLKPSGLVKKLSFSCACRLGRKINDDEKTCSDIKVQSVDEELTPYVYENILFLYNTTLENSTKGDIGKSPIYKISEKFAEKLRSDVPELSRDDALNEAYRVNKNGQIVKYRNDKLDSIIRNSSEQVANILAYDWVSKNLYYISLSNSSDNSGYKYNLFVIATKCPEKEMFLGQIKDEPTSMVVHPYRGYLIIATYDKSKNKSNIIRFNTDGKGRDVLPYSSNTTIQLTLDMAEDKIYWLDGSSGDNSQCIGSSNLDGSGTKLLINRNLPNRITTIKVYGNHIFVKTRFSKSIHKLYVFTKDGKEYFNFPVNALEVTLNAVILTKQKVKKTDTQYLSAKNPCLLNNGGCESICFAVPINDTQNLQKVCSNY